MQAAITTTTTIITAITITITTTMTIMIIIKIMPTRAVLDLVDILEELVHNLERRII